MEMYDFPEYCPDSDSTADQEQNAVLESKFTLWSEACGNEFIDHSWKNWHCLQRNM